MTCYTTKFVRARSWQDRWAAATVLYAVGKGLYHAITIRVRGSRWICHPHPEGDEWVEPTCHQPGRDHWPPSENRPSRRVRKTAKMALRLWRNP